MLSMKTLSMVAFDYGSSFTSFGDKLNELYSLEDSNFEKDCVDAMSRVAEMVGANTAYFHQCLRELSDTIRFFGQPCKSFFQVHLTYNGLS